MNSLNMMEHQDKQIFNKHTEFLRGVPIFKGLPNHFICALSSKMRTVSYKKGTNIFQDSDEANALYFVKRGIIKVKKINAEGKELIIYIKQVGDTLAEAFLFCKKGTIYHETAEALEDTEVFVLSHAELEDVLTVNPTACINMVRYMGEQIHDFTAQLLDLTLLDVYSKTIKAMVNLAHKIGCKINNGMIIEIPLSIQDLAKIIGASRESVSRAITKLREQNIITVHNRKITINSWSMFYQEYKITNCIPIK